MKRTIAAVFGLAVLATATPALAANSTSQRPCPPRNKHCVTTCHWVVLNKLGDPPTLICVTTRR